jgi:hypothetical protein
MRTNKTTTTVTTTIAPQHVATVAPNAPRLSALGTAAAQRAAMHVALAALHTTYKMPVVLPSASPATGLRALVAWVPPTAATKAHNAAMVLAQQAVYARRVVRTLRPAKLGRTASTAGLTLLPVVAVPTAKVAAKGKVAKRA